MKKAIAFLAVFLFVFAGCSQAQTGQNSSMTDDEKKILTESIPEDYEGVWIRTALFVDGNQEPNTPVNLTLNKDSYVSTSTCTNTGKVVGGSDTGYTLTIDTTNCPGVTAGGAAGYTYTIEFDKDRNVEVMTTVTGPVTEVYDRQS